MSTTRRDLLAHLLREAGNRGITTGELLQAGVGSRYSARLLELRELGWVVEAKRIRDGSWRYTLLWEPDAKKKNVPEPELVPSLFEPAPGPPSSAIFGDWESAA